MARLLDPREAQHREERRGAAVHDRRAEAAHDPDAQARLRRLVQVVEVLDQREARADGEAEDRRVDEEADAVHADQGDDDQRLEEFLRDAARRSA